LPHVDGQSALSSPHPASGHFFLRQFPDQNLTPKHFHQENDGRKMGTKK
jgi:hypothetical protein